jgi:hypothetical protein
MTKSVLAGALLCLGLSAFAQTSPVFNILDYGAKRDGSASSTAAIRAAIQACAKAGGGTVWVPAGTYLSGAIEMVSNMTLHIDSGATIRFVADRKEYPMMEHSRFEGVETRAPVANIGGYKLENIAIEGHGALTASNADWLAMMRTEPANRTAWMNLLNLLEKKEPIPPSCAPPPRCRCAPISSAPWRARTCVLRAFTSSALPCGRFTPCTART